jgi:hypothetical protein
MITRFVTILIPVLVGALGFVADVRAQDNAAG